MLSDQLALLLLAVMGGRKREEGLRGGKRVGNEYSVSPVYMYMVHAGAYERRIHPALSDHFSSLLITGHGRKG